MGPEEKCKRKKTNCESSNICFLFFFFNYKKNFKSAFVKLFTTILITFLDLNYTLTVLLPN